jgi:hypothetical protein
MLIGIALVGPAGLLLMLRVAVYECLRTRILAPRIPSTIPEGLIHNYYRENPPRVWMPIRKQVEGLKLR